MKINLCTERQGILTLTTEDGYLQSMKNWEFSAKANGQVKTLETFRTYLAGQVLPWDKDDEQRLKKITEKIQIKLNEMTNSSGPNNHLNIGLIKTTGLDEWKSAYTRKMNIILPVNKLRDYTDAALEKLIVHEIFHINSRENDELRVRLYNMLGFYNFPFDVGCHTIMNSRLVNPDALDWQFALRTQIDGEKKWVLPIIFLKDGRFEFEAGDIFDRIAFELYVMQENGSSGQIMSISEVKVFNNRFSKFGFMAHHPEELLAECYVDWLYDQSDRFSSEPWFEDVCKIFRILRI